MKDYETAWKILKGKVLTDKIAYHTKEIDKDSYTLKELLDMIKILEEVHIE